MTGCASRVESQSIDARWLARRTVGVYNELRMQIRCPTCRREEQVAADFKWRPFCSRRCKIIDLGNWLEEVYRIPGPPQPHEAEDVASEAAN